MKESVHNVSVDESGLLQKAQRHFAAGRYQDAAGLFKDLLDQVDKPDYKEQLAQCYLQWAITTASEGRFAEAVGLWESYARYTEVPLVARDRHILWLFISEDHRKAYICLEELTAVQLDHDYPELSSVLAFLLVSGRVEIAKHLPQDSALFKHWLVVQDSLSDYSNGQFERCDHSLKKLPFRSVFRDFRFLLKAQLLAGNSSGQVEALLGKIHASSLYRPVADAVIAYMQTGAVFVARVSKLASYQRCILAQARGLSANQIQLVEAISERDGWQAYKVRFELALQYRSVFGEEAARAYCLGLLEHYPDGFQDYLNYFGIKDAFEQNRIRALLCEKGRNSYDAQHYWRQCIEILQRDTPGTNHKIATILRHMADNVSGKDAVELLIERLNFEPEDRNTYLKILTFYGLNKPSPAQYQHWLQRSLLCFPDDTEILSHAVRLAIMQKAFKQALDYAQTLLKVDPSNRLAKQVLFDERIALVRSLIRRQKMDSAGKELNAAEQYSTGQDCANRLDLLRGFYVWLAQDEQQGLQLIIGALEKCNGDPVSMQFQALMEAALLNQVCPLLLPIEEASLSIQQLQRLAVLITYYAERIVDRQSLLNALDHITRPVNRSLAKHCADEALLLSWCELSERLEHFEWLSYCVDLVSETIKQKPIWLYYRTLAACRGDFSRLDHVTLFQLQNAMAIARAENDSKPVLLIGRLLEQSQAAANPFAFKADTVETDDHLPADDLYEALFGHLAVDVMERLEQKVQDIMLETDPEQFAEQTIRQYGNAFDPQTLALLFDDPDFFASASLLAAADALGIDVGVSFDEVVARFEPTLS